jgi:hypothetical protein
MSTFNTQVGAPLPLCLTSGLEIEMLVAANRPLSAISRQMEPPCTDPHPDDTRWKSTQAGKQAAQDETEHMVARLLSLAGLENVWIGEDWDARGDSNAAQMSRMSFPKIEKKDYHNWVVTQDVSVNVEGWVAADPLLGKYSWSRIEIASAVFGSFAPSPDVWIPVRHAQTTQITDVCRKLTQNMRIRFSPSCGLHLHLGLGGEPIPEDTTRRFITVMWLLEEAVLALCAPWRMTNRWARPITRHSLLASESDEDREWRAAAMQDSCRPSTRPRIYLGSGIISRLTRVQQDQIQLLWDLPFTGNGRSNLVEAISTHRDCYTATGER